MILVVFFSGGLLFGTSPFQERLTKDFRYTDEAAQKIIAAALQVFVFGSAVAAPLVDVVGPRKAAVSGLAVEVVCLLVVARAEDVSEAALTVALGLLGIGGNLLTYGSVSFTFLYKVADGVASGAGVSRDGLLTSILSGAYQVSGFIFCILQVVEFKTFFNCYAAFAALGACMAWVAYPDVVYTSARDPPLWLQPCHRVATSGAVRCGRVALEPLRSARTWLFFLSFGITASCANWGLSVFFGVATGDEALIFWMPIITNSTFVFVPFIGAMIDGTGFVAPILSLGLWATAFSAMIATLPQRWQWFTLVALNLLLSHLYALQFTYITKTYSSGLFGLIMSCSCWVQAAVNPMSLLWVDSGSWAAGAAVFACLSPLACVAWAVAHAAWRRRPLADGSAESETSEIWQDETAAGLSEALQDDAAAHASQ